MLRRRARTPSPTPTPLVFIHIPKTAGTSLARALADLKPWRSILTDAGNLSPELLQAYIALPAAERSECLLLGHATHDSFPAFGDATTLTVLRRPDEQAVSNYLHNRRDADAPLHEDANRLSFADFIRHHWQFAVFQSISLDVTRTETPISCREAFFAHVPDIFALLDQIDLVGTTDQLQAVVDAAASLLSVPAPSVVQLNRAVDLGIAADEHAELCAAYHGFADDPELAPLVAVERLLYETACRKQGAAKHA